MPEVLYLVHRLPYPPNKGDKIRSFHVLQYLAVRYSVHLGCFVDDAEDRKYIAELQKLCTTVFVADLHRFSASARSVKGFFGGQALSLPYYFDKSLALWVDGILESREISSAIVFSSPMAQYVLRSGRGRLRRVMDFVDLDSDKWQQYAARSPLPSKWMYSREARLLAKFEQHVADKFDAVVFVSENETSTFAQQHPSSRNKQFTVPNGVATDYFDPSLDFPSPFEKGTVPVVFTGVMNYWPNVDAMCWFAREVLPEVRRTIPYAELWIAGARPAKEVLALGSIAGVKVTGTVEDVRPYLKHAAVVVAPVRIARGVQNKVLEALAMGRPVVCTPQAASGLNNPAAAPVRVADTPREFVTTIAGCLQADAGAALSARTRQYVLDNYNWEQNLGLFDTLIGTDHPSLKTAAVTPPGGLREFAKS